MVCSQAYVVQVYFIHAYSINCNRIPQISNRERKMKKEHNKKCVEEKGTKLSSLPVYIISETENKVATVATFCLRV